MILMREELSENDILDAVQVTKALRARTTSSLRLQRKLVRSDWIGFWTTFFDAHARGPQCYHLSIRRLERGDYEVDIFVRMVRDVDWRRAVYDFASFSITLRKLLVCQPTFKYSQAIASCCGGRGGSKSCSLSPQNSLTYESISTFSRPTPVVVHSSTGLTIGHISEVAKEISSDHQNFPFAHYLDHNEVTDEIHSNIEFLLDWCHIQMILCFKAVHLSTDTAPNDVGILLKCPIVAIHGPGLASPQEFRDIVITSEKVRLTYPFSSRRDCVCHEIFSSTTGRSSSNNARVARNEHR